MLKNNVVALHIFFFIILFFYNCELLIVKGVTKLASLLKIFRHRRISAEHYYIKDLDLHAEMQSEKINRLEVKY